MRLPRVTAELTACLTACLSLALTPRLALAQEEPSVEVEGSVAATDAAVTVRCTAQGDAVACELTASYRLAADDDGPARVRFRGPGLEVDRAPAPIARTLAPGESADIRLRWRRGLSREPREIDHPFDFGAEPFAFSGLRARHPWLGEGVSRAPGGERAVVSVLGGARVESAPALRLDAGEAARVDVRVNEGITVAIDTRLPAAPVILHGGPFVGLNGWVGAAGHPPGPRARLAAGYELGITELFVASLAFETDFRAIAQALVIEIVSPQVWFVAPSASAGIGVVARQLGDRDADAALRLRAGLSWPVVGFVFDADYWPAVGGWTLAFGARLGL